MRKFFYFFVVFSFLFSNKLFPLDVVVKNDNNVPKTSGYVERYFWEESKILKPDGPCILKKLQIYFVGDYQNRDTIYIMGDPSEGYLPPTLWVANYNLKTDPIIFDYPGKPGWYEFPAGNIYLAGLDRVVILHRLNQKGPFFAIDNDGLSTPYSSFLMNPFENNSLGGPGNYYIANGDFLVRLVVEYVYPFDSTSAKPPVPQFFDVTTEVGLTLPDGKYIGSNDVSVVDWNNDGWDDIAIESYFFQNNGDGTFTDVSKKFNITASMTSWGDFNNDGFIDCYALRNGNYDENLKMVFSLDRVYKNNGNGTFTMLNPKDIFSLPYPSPSEDFNLSTPNQQDSIPNPYNCITPLWADFNGDGRLDLFLANNRVGVTVAGNYVERYFPDQLWIQDKNGKFKNVTKTAGLPQFELFSPSSGALGYYDCYGANACDYNNDGKVDIFVANYRLVRDLLYKNNGDGTFTNVGDVTGVQGVPTAAPNYFGHGMGAEWGDFNNDGNPDLAVGNLGHPDWRGMYSNPSLIFENQGPPDYKFREVHQKMGLKFFEMNAGMTWGDFDLDGYLDLWHGQISYRAEGDGGEPKRPGRIYFNTGAPDFKLIDKTWEVGAIIHGPWNAVRIDYDNDGDLDLLVASPFEGVRLLRNDLERKGNWVEFRLIGSPENSVNMDCYGTKIYLYAGGRKFYRELMGSISGNRCSQNSNSLHFGLGNTRIIDSVVVVYLNGFRKKYTNVKANNIYLIKYNDELKKLLTSTPVLIYPKNFQQNLPDSLCLAWNFVDGATSYEIIISEDKDFKNHQKYFSNDSTLCWNKGSKSKQYFWKVRAITTKDTSSWSSVYTFFVGNPIPPAIQLIAPINDSKKMNLTPTFKWSRPKFQKYLDVEVSFEFQIAEENSFQNPHLYLKGLKDTILTLDSNYLYPAEKYYWRVRAVNKDGDGVWSEVFSFETNTLPSVVVLTSPEDNASGVPLKPTFKWTQIENVDDYIFQLSKSPTFDSLVTEKFVQSAIYKHLTSLEPDVEYFWRVAGRNNVGAGPWSTVWQFRTISASVVEIDENGFSVFPNPTDGLVFIKLPFKGNYKVRIFDFLGREICKATLREGVNLIDLSSYSESMFYLIIENGKFLSKIVILKK